MIDIPPNLINGIKEQRAVLFLGAGASRNARSPCGTQIPNGDNLRDKICDKFLGSELKQKPLTFVAGVASSEVGIRVFQSYIRELFLPFEPTDFHSLIPKFRWRAIATTNFDLIVERAYQSTQNRLQNLVKIVKDDDNFDTRLNLESTPVGFYKLHGCIDHYTDCDIPLILNNEQYASYLKNRTRFYSRLRDLAHEYPIVFAGYSISDPHILQLLFDLTDSSVRRPPFYLISPKIVGAEKRYWINHRVHPVETTFENFIRTINQIIPARARAIPVGIGGGELSIRKHYCSAQSTEPLFLKSYLETDAKHIHSGLRAIQQDPKQFYRGYDSGWGCILQGLDAERSVTDSVLLDAVLLSEENRRVVELFMLKGPGGNGKSVSLKRIAWEAGVNHNKLTLYASNPSSLRIEPLAEIHRLTDERIFLFVDHVALVRDELRALLQASQTQSVPLSVIGAERDNEWNIYCEKLEPFVHQEFPVRYLNATEIDRLLSLLERHNSLGFLEYRSHEDRVSKFTEGAERQLLVALHEATLGVPFVDIVFDEYQRIEPLIAREIYLEICALHQFGAPVRAGLISRSSGVGFERFKTEFIKPLQNIVRVIEDDHSRDIYYRCRHQHVAEILFYRVLSSPDDRFELLAKLLENINIDYSSDRATFVRMIRGRGVAEMFPNSDVGRLFYDRLEEAVPKDPYIFHQRAVFELVHQNGSLILAERAAALAFELNPKKHSIKHTQAEIARRQANETDDSLRKRTLRRFTREKLGNSTIYPSEYDHHTRVLLAIDEFKELSDSLEIFDDKPHHKAFVNAVKDVESVIHQGLQYFPESSELLSAEATFRDHLNQSDRAQQILEKAFNLNPRQDWLAVRLARKFQSTGDSTRAKMVLEKCLQINPSSKLAHLELGRIFIGCGENEAAIEHLKRSFTEGDNNFESQFWYARELFLQGHFPESERLFATVNDRAPGRFRSHASAKVEQQNGIPIVYQCSVERKEEGYAFLKLPQFPKNIFASRAESNFDEWGNLSRKALATCVLAFNRRGPRAISVCINS